jgi:hypothetical protein
MKRYVTLRRIDGDRELLQIALQEAGYSVLAAELPDDELGRLWHADFDAVATNGEALAFAQATKRGLDAVRALRAGATPTFEPGAVMVRYSDGAYHKHAFSNLVGTIRIGLTGFATLTDGSAISPEERERLRRAEDERQAKAAGKLAALAADDLRVTHVIELLSKSSLTPTQLGVMLELIEDQRHSLRTYASGKQLARFRGSVNNWKVFGTDARHGVSNYEVPRRPMTRKEADEFARGVARRWLDDLSK